MGLQDRESGTRPASIAIIGANSGAPGGPVIEKRDAEVRDAISLPGSRGEGGEKGQKPATQAFPPDVTEERKKVPEPMSEQVTAPGRKLEMNPWA